MVEETRSSDKCGNSNIICFISMETLLLVLILATFTVYARPWLMAGASLVDLLTRHIGDTTYSGGYVPQLLPPSPLKQLSPCYVMTTKLWKPSGKESGKRGKTLR